MKRDFLLQKEGTLDSLLTWTCKKFSDPKAKAPECIPDTTDVF